MLVAVLATLDRVDTHGLDTGTGVGNLTFVGTVRRADSAAQAIAELLPGEVLVVRFTTPAYNLVLPLAGALVTAEGGPLSHAAVLARELDLPAVIGVRNALDLISGTTVMVDPPAGRISPLT